MADQLYTVTGTSPRLSLALNSYTYADILPVNTVFAGGFFAIQEIATLVFSIDEPHLVDVNFNYFEPNALIGSWQVLRNTGILDPGGGLSYEFGGTTEPTEQGFFTKEVCKLERISYHSVGDTTIQPRLNGRSHIDNCNYFSINGSFEIGGVIISGGIQQDATDVYTTRDYIIPPPLQDKDFSPILAVLGIFVRPGVSLQSARWDCTPINILTIDTAIEAEYTCRIAENVDCNQITIDYCNNNPNAYIGLAECDAANPGGNCQMVNIIIDPRCGEVSIWENLQ
jgi:hypothetical protein